MVFFIVLATTVEIDFITKFSPHSNIFSVMANKSIQGLCNSLITDMEKLNKMPSKPAYQYYVTLTRFYILAFHAFRTKHINQWM
jgi:hypothetical protein